MPQLLGCIADDFTGATDLAATLVNGGLRVLQVLGIPDEDAAFSDVDALVVALKTRAMEPDAAVRLSLAALDWLRRRGASHLFFKYCSTFDSTPQGNIGPVIGALLDALGARITIACPAFPDNGRTVYQGHLFVGDKLLCESGMERHPLNPMTDPNLVRFLQRQTSHPVGLLPYAVVQNGPQAIRNHLSALEDSGSRIAIVDAITNDDVRAIGSACADLALLTGASGLAQGLPDAYRAAGLVSGNREPAPLPRVAGGSAILAGSCSAMTLRQIGFMQQHCPALAVSVDDVVARSDHVDQVLAWAADHLARGPVLIYSSAPPEQVAAAQQQLGQHEVGTMMERTMAAIATGLVQRGVRRLVVAGGETSGAVVGALGAKTLLIGPSIVPGVPWTETLEHPRLALALKSGNFGAEDFFLRALEMLK